MTVMTGIPLLVFLVIISVAVNTMHAQQTRLLNTAFEEQVGASMIMLENQSRQLITTFDWPLLEELQETASLGEGVVAIWIDDELSGRVFGEVLENPLQVKGAQHFYYPIVDEQEVLGTVHIVISTEALDEALNSSNRSALAVVSVSALFAVLVFFVFHAVRQRSVKRIEEYENIATLAAKELHVNEELLSAVLENIPAAVFLRRPDGAFLRVNREYEKIYDLTNAEVHGKSLWDVHTKEMAEQYAALDHVILEQGQVVRTELAVEQKSGVRYFDMLKFPITDAANEIIAIGGIKHDVTESKLADRILNIALDKAEHASRVKSEFLANMSHELRTPLNAVIGYSQSLQQETFGPIGSDKNREYIDIITEAGAHLLNVIGDILDLSKVEAGEGELFEEPINIGKILDECGMMVSERATRKQLSFSVEVQKGPLSIFADRLRLKQILLNLFSNAIKFTPPNGEVSVVVSLNEENSIVIRVQDTGVGIAPEEIASVMEPFSQIGNSSTTSQEGSGLGLTLVKMMTELHNGTVTLESTINAGTVVCLQFPPDRTVSI